MFFDSVDPRALSSQFKYQVSIDNFLVESGGQSNARTRATKLKTLAATVMGSSVAVRESFLALLSQTDSDCYGSMTDIGLDTSGDDRTNHTKSW